MIPDGRTSDEQQETSPPPHVSDEEFAAKTDAPHGIRANNVKNLNLRAPVEVDSRASLNEAITRMREGGSDCVVIRQAERIAGVFTECDFLTKVIGREVDMNASALQFASSGVATLSSAATVGDAVNAIGDGCCRNIIITEDGKIVGTISDLDLITYLAESYPKETMNLPPVPAQIMDTQEGG